MSVRWRINASGVEWFWKGRWHNCSNPQMTTNLLTTINSVVATYASARRDPNELYLEDLIA